jgi:hypothetical protein
VTTPQEIQDRLAAPFDPAEVKFKPQAVKGERALAIAYVDARVVMDRLDEAVGIAGWEDSYAVLPGDQVQCQLTVIIDGRPITKSDVGGESEQPDDGDKRKAAFSDALKRTAVKFGIGRYLYRLPQQWADFDPAKKLFRDPDQLRRSLGPKNSGPAKATKPAKAAAPEQPRTASGELPKDVPELLARIAAADKALADRGQAPWGELTNYVVGVATKAGYSADKAQWDASVIDLAVRAVREYKKQKGIA